LLLYFDPLGHCLFQLVFLGNLLAALHFVGDHFVVDTDPGRHDGASHPIAALDVVGHCAARLIEDIGWVRSHHQNAERPEFCRRVGDAG
jgi:hypothetical protein